MPVWQPRPDWFSEAVSSALAQVGCDIELIIVDDGCEPPVAELVDAICDSRMSLIRIEHGGQAAALNAGVSAASGDWFRFIDADDVITPQSTKRLLELCGGELVVSYGATVVCDEHLQPYASISSTIQGGALTDCLLGRFATRHPSMLFPRPVVEAAGPWDTTLCVSADWEFVARALEHADVRGDQSVATLYRRHRRSISRTATIAAGEETRRLIIERYLTRHPERRGSRIERLALGEMYFDRARACWSAREYARSLTRFAKAMHAQPLIGTIATAGFLGGCVHRRIATSIGSRLVTHRNAR
jgi:glycosyltransferase involved in cell wall biosynthesis